MVDVWRFKNILGLVVIFMGGTCALANSLGQPPKFTSTPVESGTLGDFYEYNITTSSEEDTNVEILLTSGDLPANLDLTDLGDGNGLLAGTLEELGDFPLELTVREVLKTSHKDTQKFTITVQEAEATVTLSDMTTTYTGSAQSPTVTTDPSGLAVDITYNGSSTVPTNAGSYEVVATVNDPDYTGSATGIFVINKATATVTLTDMTRTYTGSPLSPTVTTSPSGLAVDITYDGSSTAPTAVGNYAIVATVNDQNYTGSATGTFEITKATATVTLTDMTQAYTGSPLSPTVTTAPSGLAVGITYNGSSTAPTAVGSYAVVATINDPNYTGSASGTFEITKATATVTLSDMTQAYTGSPLSPTVTTTPSGLTVNVTYDGSSTTPSAVGTYAVVATVSDPNYAGSASGTFEITNDEATVTLTDMTKTYTGSPQSPTVTTDPSGLAVDITYDGSSTAPTNAGSYAVIATINDPNYTGSATGTFVINKATATVTLSDMTKAYTGSPQSPTVTTTPSGLTVNVTYDGSSTAPSAVGTYAVVATVSDPNYAGSASGTFEITNDEATVTLTDMTKTYTGSPQSPTVTTDPSGLAVDITYDGSSTAPTNAGSYAVIATINDPNYTGSATGTFVINKAAATVTLTDMTKAYTGSPQSPTVTTDPSGLTVNVTYDGSSTAPSAVGSYAVVATVSDPNYTGSASGTFSITDSEATVTLSDMIKTYTGNPLSPTVTTTPSGLAVDVTYDGFSAAPTNAGTYEVVATISDPGYTGSASGTFVINKATATVSLSNLSAVYDGTPKGATATTTPAGLGVKITYNGSLTPPTNVGSYSVVATIDNPNYTGTTSNTFTITSASATVSLSNLTQTYNGTPRTVTATTTPTGLDVNITYAGSSTPPTNAGSYAVVAAVDDPNYQGSANGTLVIQKAAAIVTLSNLIHNYDGSPKPVTVSTDPAGLAVTVTYNGSTTVPSAAGGYSVVATVTDNNYSGSATGTLQINGPPTSSGIADITLNEDAADYSINLRLAFDDTEDDDTELDFTVQSNSNPSLFTSYDINSSGQLVLNFAPDQNGMADIRVRATDSGGLYVEDEFRVTINPVQDDPIFVTSPVTGAVRGQEYVYNPQTTDPDAGDVLTYTNVVKPSWLTFQDNGDGSGTLTGIPDAAAVGQHNVILEVSDDKGNKVVQFFTLKVVETNEDPSFTSTPVTGATEGQLYSYNAAATDPDAGDIPMISAVTKPAWLEITDHGNGTATIEGTPSNIDVGAHSIILRATDTFGAFDEQSFTITVTNVNDAPEFVSEPISNAVQGVQYEYQIEIEDGDVNDSHTITASQIPDWLTLTDHGNGTAVLSGTHPENSVNNLAYQVHLIVEDAAGASDEQQFTITVEYQNYPPTLDPIADHGPVDEDSGPVTVNLSGISDGEGEEQSLSIQVASDNEALVGTFNINYTSPSSTGTVILETEADQYGEANITVTVQDDGAEMINSISRTFKFTVSPVNDKPFFENEPEDQKVVPGQEVAFSVQAEDKDAGDALTLSMTTTADWLSLSDNGNGAAVVSGIVPDNVSGEDFLISIKATDQVGEFTTVSFTVSVNRAPAISNMTFVISEDEALQFSLTDFDIRYTDPDEDVIVRVKFPVIPGFAKSFTWNGQTIQPGTEIEVNNGVIDQLIYMPPQDEAGETKFTWAAFDGYEWSDEAEVTIQVESVNDKPFLSKTETEPLSYRQADDPAPVTTTTIVNDVDNTHMEGATVAFTKGYISGEDVLQYKNSENPNITGEFNVQEGVMTLTGSDTRSNYEKALSEILYKNSFLGETGDTEKSISIAVTDGEYYSDAVMRNIIISEVLPDLDIVNAFTPNNDGVNDNWDFTNLEYYSSISISVFNENGTRVFSCSEANCEWDGTMGGKPLPAGSYFYTIDLNNGKRKYQGVVAILK